MKNSLVSLAALALGLAACSSSAPDPSGEPRPVASMAGTTREGSIQIDGGTASVAATLDAPVDRAWAAVKAGYTALGIPITSENDALHKMGNAGYARLHTFNNVPLTRLADCGNGPDGPNAATFRVTFSIYTALTAAGTDKSTIDTQVSVSAFDVTGNGNTPVCASTGALEKMVADAVRKSLTP